GSGLKTPASPVSPKPGRVADGGLAAKFEKRLITEKSGIVRDSVKFFNEIFIENVAPPTVSPGLPELNKPLTDTQQLAYCLTVLNEVELDSDAQKWRDDTVKDLDELKRLSTLVRDVVRAFERDELKDADAVAEVTFLGPFLGRPEFRFLLAHFVDGLEHSMLLDLHSLEGIARLVQSAAPNTLIADDLVRTLGCINKRMHLVHGQAPDYVYQMTITVSRVLDAMADCHVNGLKREDLHEPLSAYLEGLKGHDDPHIVFQAAYAFQALQCVPDNESPWQAARRRGGSVLRVAFQLATAVKALDVNSFIDGLCTLQSSLEGAYKVVEMTMDAYDKVKTLYKSGQDLKMALQDGLSFSQKRTWYTALRGADMFLQNGQLADFETMVYTAPCRHDLAFQWGVCQRLGNLAADSLWHEPRLGAIEFLGRIYQDDKNWGHHVPVKQLILDLLKQLAGLSDSVGQAANALLVKLKDDYNAEMRDVYEACLRSTTVSHPLQVAKPPLASSSLLDRVQGKLDVEADLKRLKLQRIKLRGTPLYIPPQAKANLRAQNTDLFDLMDKVNNFLDDKDQKVLLLLGESGVGKSTFNMELEYHWWCKYEKKTDRIPLFISLPAIVRPEQDLIVKHLRKVGFEESQIRELRGREFILICDGYDESQQTQNLYRSNSLNQSGGWSAQMVISCRSEYLGHDHRDQFQPADRNHQANPALFQEAVIVPFSEEQVQAYVDKYVSAEAPLWNATDYANALSQIPSLQDLVKNPFMLTLSLDVLPRMVDLGENLSTARITRVGLYDHFIKQWLERGKKRLAEKTLLGAERRAFEVLVKEGFTENGIAFLKDLAAAIYERQSGNPVVEYRRLVDIGTWKDTFFGREYEKQLLLEASPFSFTGNQCRFIHKSLLEYCVARAVFEPSETGSSVGSRSAPHVPVSSFENQGGYKREITTATAHTALESVLTRINFAGESSILQFLEERVQDDAVFKQQLFEVIERSKTDKALHLAAANAITILNVARPATKYELPEPNQLITSTPQLAYCLSLLPSPTFSADELDETELAWSQAKVTDLDEQQRLWALATDLVTTFIDEEDFSQETMIAEVVCMAPVLDQNQLRSLIMAFVDGIKQDTRLEILQFKGLAQLIQCDTRGYLNADDLVKISKILGMRLQHTLQQPIGHPYPLALAVSHVLDAMADCHVKNLSHEQLYKPLSTYLNGLQSRSDPCLVYQAAYAFQALLHVPNDEFLVQTTPWQTIKAAHGTIGVKSSAKDLDLESFIGGLLKTQDGLPTSNATQIVASTETPVKDRASLLLQELENNGDMTKRALLQAFIKETPTPHPLTVPAPQLTSSLLLDRVQNKPDVETDLHLLGETLREKMEGVYIPLHAKPSLEASDYSLFDLMEGVRDFLDSDRKVFLVLGDSGAGKSTFCRELEKDLWRDYKKWYGKIPLFINLPEISKPERDLIPKQLRRLGFSDRQIRELKNRKFILICDGYDETLQTRNLYTYNRLNQPGEWSGQMIVSCRSEYLGNDYMALFLPVDQTYFTESEGFQEAVIAPFSMGLVREYVKRYVSIYTPLWRTKDYLRALDLIPHLKDWTTNPFLLTLALDTLPRLGDPGKPLSVTLVTRVELYDRFVEQWLERSKKRLFEKDLSGQEMKVLQALSDDGFLQNGIEFLKRLAAEVYDKQHGNPVIKYSRLHKGKSWKDEFFGDEDEKRLLRESCPLKRNGDQYQFIHRSILEYGLTRAIFEPQNTGTEVQKVEESAEILERRGSVLSDFSLESEDSLEDRTSVYSFEMDGALEDVKVPIAQGPDDSSPLFKRSFIGEPSILQFLGERVQQEPVFKKQLLEYIEASKVDKKWRIASANAITIMVRAGIPFNGADLKGIQIPGADLSNGQFDSVQLQKADLRQTALSNIWMRQADLSNARMEGVEFGERPYLMLESSVSCCMYSPDGRACALSLENGTINVYNSLTWTKIHTLQGHKDGVTCAVYSPSAQQIASGGEDNTVRLWDAQTGVPGPVLSGHTKRVTSVAYSPSGQEIASGSHDMTVWLWDAQSGAPSHILRGHTDAVTSVAYSPYGQQIASSSFDETVRLWDTQSGTPGLTLTGHTDAVTSVAYSPRGQQIASSSFDETVRLWDTQSGTLGLILTGHTRGPANRFRQQGYDSEAMGRSKRSISSHFRRP
ncbi:hypothetical protein BGZ99_000468, partial [Dissophora globulifera]